MELRAITKIDGPNNNTISHMNQPTWSSQAQSIGPDSDLKKISSSNNSYLLLFIYSFIFSTFFLMFNFRAQCSQAKAAGNSVKSVDRG